MRHLMTGDPAPGRR